MPDFRDSFTAREVCEGMLSQINVLSFSFGSGLGVRDPRPRIAIVICPLFPFWSAGRPV